MNTLNVIVVLCLAWCVIAGIFVVAASCHSARFLQGWREDDFGEKVQKVQQRTSARSHGNDRATSQG